MGKKKAVENENQKFIVPICECGSKLRPPRYEKCYRGHTVETMRRLKAPDGERGQRVLKMLKIAKHIKDNY